MGHCLSVAKAQNLPARDQLNVVRHSLRYLRIIPMLTRAGTGRLLQSQAKPVAQCPAISKEGRQLVGHHLEQLFLDVTSAQGIIGHRARLYSSAEDDVNVTYAQIILRLDELVASLKERCRSL